MILIAGAGQNVGKTTLACKLIEKLAQSQYVSAVKVAGHHHQLTAQQTVVYRGNGLLITIETNATSHKDTSRYIRAGAHQSFFVLCNETGIDELVDWMNKQLKGWVICESGIVGKFMTPDVALFVEGNDTEKRVEWSFNFQKIRMVGDNFEPPFSSLLNFDSYEND